MLSSYEQITNRSTKKGSPWGDSNPQPPDPKSDALSIAPQGLACMESQCSLGVEHSLSKRKVAGSNPAIGSVFFGWCLSVWPQKEKKKKLEKQGIDPCASRMLSVRSTI